MAHKRLRDGWIPVGHKEEKIAVIGMVMIMIRDPFQLTLGFTLNQVYLLLSSVEISYGKAVTL